MGGCVSISVKYEETEVVENVFETPFQYTMMTYEKSVLEQKCDEIGVELLGLLPRAPIIRI
jgi:hypothetical protein